MFIVSFYIINTTLASITPITVVTHYRPRGFRKLVNTDTNYQNNVSDTMLVITNVSYHYAVLATFLRDISLSKMCREKNLRRNYNRVNRNAFNDALNSVDWIELCVQNISVEQLAKNIIYVLITKIDICFPLKKANQFQNDTS